MSLMALKMAYFSKQSIIILYFYLKYNSKKLNKMAQFEKGNRDMIQFISSLITLVAGIVLVFLGFFAVPIGVIDYSVITSFGLFLSFVGAVWHIDIKYNYKTKEIEREIKKDKN